MATYIDLNPVRAGIVEDPKDYRWCGYAEALAAGTPSVAYEGGGVSSIITPETGVLTERTPKALGSEIRDLLNDPERLNSMALKGRKRAEEHFSAIRLGEKLKDWLAQICLG